MTETKAAQSPALGTVLALLQAGLTSSRLGDFEVSRMIIPPVRHSQKTETVGFGHSFNLSLSPVSLRSCQILSAG